MPTRFRFDLECEGQVIRDEEGVEADDLEQAIAQAFTEIEKMRATGELDQVEAGWDMVVRDEKGTELARLPI